MVFATVPTRLVLQSMSELSYPMDCPTVKVRRCSPYSPNFFLLTSSTAAAVVPASGQIKDTPTPAALTALGTTTGAAETKVSSPSPSASANPSGKVAGADIVSTFTSGDKTITTTLQSISALATGVPDKHDSDDGPSSGVRGHNKDNNDSSSSTTLATQADAADVTGSGDEATETTTRVATSSLHGGVAPMVTGALNGLSNAPVVIAAAAALLI